MCSDQEYTSMQETNEEEVKRLRDKTTNGPRGLILNLDDETYHEFPIAVLELTGLHELHLSISNLSSIPKSINSLKSLKVLELRANDFDTFPEAVCGLSNLEVLDLSENQISTIPAEIRNLTHLVTLNLQSNKIEGKLSENIANLKSLQCLNLSKNAIQTVPDCFENLSELTHLILSTNVLEKVPNVLSKLTKLRVLDISYNALKEFSLDISGLKQLENLDLESTKLTVLDDVVCSLTSLQRLDLGLNLLEFIPERLCKLTNLKALWLNNNKFTRFPDVVCKLRSLETLSISYNNIKTLPSALAYLGNLRMLELASCGLEQQMPLSICMLTSLTFLSLADNNLTKLPPVLRTSLPNLNYLNLDNNENLVVPPVSVSKRGIKAVFNYMDETDTKKTTYHKLVFLGNVRAGKSSLTKTMIHDSSFLSKDADRTIVLDQFLWTPQEHMSIQVYDFGGSEWYCIVQHFFLEKNSLVLLVVDLHEYSDETYTDCVEKWLKIIQARAPGAKLFVVATHTDMLSKNEVRSKQASILETLHAREKREVDQVIKEITRLEQLGKEGESAVKGLQISLENRLRLPDKVYAVSSKTLENIAELKSDVLSTAKSVGGDIPTSWLVLFDALHSSELSKSKSFLTIKDVAHLDREAEENFRARHAFSPNIYRKHPPIMTQKSLSKDTTSNSKTKKEVHRKISDHTRPFQRPPPIENDEKSFRRRLRTIDDAHVKRSPREAGASESRLEDILSFFHSIGDVLWYKGNPEISKFVFHKQSFIINLLKSIFSESPGEICSISKSLKLATTTKSLERAVDELRNGGIMSIGLLKGMLDHLSLDDKFIDAIVQLLIHFGLCFAEEYQANRITKLHFPWFLDESVPLEADSMLKQSPRLDRRRFILEYDFPLGTPRVLFETTSVRIHGIIHDKASIKHWKSGVHARLLNSTVLLYRSQSSDSETISFSVEGKDTDELWKILIQLHGLFSSLLENWPGILLEMWLVCPHCTSSGEIANPYRFQGENITRSCAEGEEYVTCPKDNVSGSVPVNLVYPMRACCKDVSEKQIFKVAKMVGKEWRPLGRALGLDEYELDSIDHDHKELQEQSYQMLRRWRQSKGIKADLKRLVEALSTMEPMHQDIVDILLPTRVNEGEDVLSTPSCPSLLNKTL